MEATSPFRVRYEAEARPPASPAERLAGVDDLFETALAMRKARFIREHPHAAPEETVAALQAWLLEPRLADRIDERPIEGARLQAIRQRTEPG